MPLGLLGNCLHQHDIRLDDEIISHGRRTHVGGAASAVYEQLVGPLPATAVRTVWVALRFDTLRRSDAVARRGGDAGGAIASVGIAAARTVATLAASGHRARVLTAAEIRDAVLRVAAGPTRTRHDWVHLPGDRAPAEMLGVMRHLELSRDIRSAWQYNNLCYNVAGLLIERLSGQSYEAFIRARLTEGSA